MREWITPWYGHAPHRPGLGRAAIPDSRATVERHRALGERPGQEVAVKLDVNGVPFEGSVITLDLDEVFAICTFDICDGR